MTDLVLLQSTGNSEKASNDWRTPDEVLSPVRQLGPIGLDPCASRTGLVKATTEWYGPPDDVDGLSRSWAGHGLVFVNPPYGKQKNGVSIATWVRHAAIESRKLLPTDQIVLLVPARTDTHWWHDYVVRHARSIAFWRGRVNFVGGKYTSTFPSALVHYVGDDEKQTRRFAEVFENYGAWIAPTGN